MIQTRLSFTKEDIKNAFDLHYASNFPIRSKLMIISGIGLLLTGFLLTVKPDIVDGLPYLKFVFMGLGVFYIVFYFYRKKVLIDTAHESPSLAGEHLVTINEESVSYKNPDGVAMKKWSDFRKAVVNQDTILLYFSDNQFFILPRKLFNQTEIKNIQDLISKNIEDFVQK
jgi:hypothetical protein